MNWHFHCEKKIYQDVRSITSTYVIFNNKSKIEIKNNIKICVFHVYIQCTSY